MLTKALECLANTCPRLGRLMDGAYRYICGGQPGPISKRMMQPLLHRSHIELNI